MAIPSVPRRDGADAADGRPASGSPGPLSTADPDAPGPGLMIARPRAEDLAAVRASCAAVQDRPVRLAESFYQHLFEMAPHARPMFAADMSVQMQTMTEVLLGAIAGLQGGDTTELEQTLHRLGAVHRQHLHVQDEHYLYIPHALTRAVRDVAGAGWSGRLSSSWIALTQWITAHMLAGADAAEAHQRVPRPRQPVLRADSA